MADLVGSRVSVPGDEWDPKEEGFTDGVISKYLPPSARYPGGRVEVRMDVGGVKYLFPLDKFPSEWITSAPEQPKTATKASAKSTRTASKAAVSDAWPASPSATGVRTRTSTRIAQAAAASTADHPGRAGHREEEGGSRSPRGRSVKSKSPRSRRSRRPAGATGEEEITPMTSGAGGPSTPAWSSPPRMGALVTGSTSAAAVHSTQPAAPIRMVPRLPTRQTIINGILLVAVAVPALLYGAALAHGWVPQDADRSKALAAGPPRLLDLSWWLALGYHYPFLAANLVFFLNVDVLFWVLSIVQRSTWLIDPYWTIIPVMVAFFYKTHPLASADPTRSLVCMTLVCIWSARLTHSYFRREEWQLGAREDWRFTSMAKQIGPQWWWISFFAAYLSQHVMLMGITWPLLSVHTVALPWDPVWDTLATLAAASGIMIAAVADTQLQAFMVENERRKSAGLRPILILDLACGTTPATPNYFGELLFWWGLSLFALRLGQPWVMTGAVINILAMVAVTKMVEERMMLKKERVEAWLEYCRTTSVWIPLPKRRSFHA